METRMQLPGRLLLKEIGHVAQDSATGGLDPFPLFRLGILQLVCPFITTEKCQGASVRVRGILDVGHIRFAWTRDEFQACITGTIFLVGCLQARPFFQAQAVGQHPQATLGNMTAQS